MTSPTGSPRVPDRSSEVRRYVTRLKADGRYPNLTELFEAGPRPSRDERFDYGLTCLLDGIENDLS